MDQIEACLGIEGQVGSEGAWALNWLAEAQWLENRPIEKSWEDRVIKLYGTFYPHIFLCPPEQTAWGDKIQREGEWMARGAREGESVSLTFVTLHVCLLLNTTATAYIASSSRHWSNSGNSRGAWETRRSARSVRGIGRFCKRSRGQSVESIPGEAI